MGRKTATIPQAPDTADHRSGRDDLIEQYRVYVHRIARGLRRSLALPPEVEREFVSAGYLGLVEAANRFTLKSKRQFRTFAFLRIRGAIIDSMRKNSDLSGTAYRYARALKAIHALRNSDDELAEKERIKRTAQARLNRIFDYAAKGALAFRLSYCDLKEELDCNPQIFGDPELDLQCKQARLSLREVVRSLPAPERSVIEEFYFEGVPFSELSLARNGASKSWISRLHRRALEKLTRMIRDQSIKDEVCSSILN